MDPATIQTGLSIVGGLAGMFGKKKRDPREQMAMDALASQQRMGEEYWRQAMAYDPASEDARAFRMANTEASSAISRALRGLNAEYAKGGGSPSGDTNFAIQSARTQNSVADPLRAMVLQSVQTESQRKLGALGQALSMARPGELASQYAGLSQAFPQSGPNAGAMGLLSSGIDQWVKGSGKKKNAIGDYMLTAPNGQTVDARRLAQVSFANAFR